MEPLSVSFYHIAMTIIITHDGMLSVRIIRMCFKKSWMIGRGDQRTNRVTIGNRNGSYKRIIGIPDCFVLPGTIINGNGRDIQIWDIKIN